MKSLNDLTPMPLLAAALRESLAGADYSCDSALGGQTVRVRFIGRFENQEVVWDATLIALAVTADSSAQFIDISAPGERGIPITIGLRVDKIDQPTLHKTLIMVRNYKRLHYGRHEFGAGVAAATQPSII